VCSVYCVKSHKVNVIKKSWTRRANNTRLKEWRLTQFSLSNHYTEGRGQTCRASSVTPDSWIEQRASHCQRVTAVWPASRSLRSIKIGYTGHVTASSPNSTAQPCPCLNPVVYWITLFTQYSLTTQSGSFWCDYQVCGWTQLLNHTTSRPKCR